MSSRFSRLLAVAMIVFSAGAMLTASFDAEARRMGGGKSFGRQSSNITQQRQAVTPPAAAATPRAAAPAAGAAAAGTAAKSGASRWLGPIAGIAAGLGIAALLSHLGMSGAFLEMMSSLALIALLVFGVMFIVRRLRAGAARTATQGAGHGNNPMQRQGAQQQNVFRQNGAAATPAATPAAAAPERPSCWIRWMCTA